jgi:hypothetical protein
LAGVNFPSKAHFPLLVFSPLALTAERNLTKGKAIVIEEWAWWGTQGQPLLARCLWRIGFV